MGLELDPGALCVLALAAVLYARAVRVLGRRGYRVPALQQAAWWCGLGLIAVALLGPPAHLAHDLLSGHMAEHLLLADLGVPLTLIGLRTPVLVFLLPRPVLVPLARAARLRRAFRFLRRPLVAVAVFALLLWAWHLASLFEAALRDPALHALQHASFAFGSMLVWWEALEPKRRRPRGELWKIGYVFGARTLSMFVGVALLASRDPVYGGFYGERAREHGLSPIADQQLGAGLMMSVDVAIILVALGYFFWRASEEERLATERDTLGVPSQSTIS